MTTRLDPLTHEECMERLAAETVGRGAVIHEGYPGGVGRRKGDGPIEVAAESGPALAQDDIDSLFKATVTGQD